METLGNIFYEKKLTFFCNICQIDCRHKSDYIRHLLTRKHTSQSQWKCQETKFAEFYEAPEYGNNYKCILCNLHFQSRSGLWKHKQKCKNSLHNNDNQLVTNNEDNIKGITLDQETFYTIVKQNKELLDLIKSGTTNISNTYNSNNINSNNINSNNKTFNLQLFLNETCKNAMNISDFVSSIKPTLEDLENVGRVGYVEGISNIIINKLNNMEVSERPIHCSDLKREVLYIKTENEWNKETEEKPILLKAIKEVANKNMKNILEWQKKYPGCTNSDSRKNDLYLNIVSNSMCGSTKEDITKNFNKIISKVSKKVSICDCKI